MSIGYPKPVNNNTWHLMSFV